MYKKLNYVWVLTKRDKIIFDKYFGISSIVMYNPIDNINYPISTYNTKNILFVGRINYKHKGLNHLLLIFQKIINNPLYKDIILLIVGDGPDVNKLIRDIDRLKINDNVKFVGKTNDVYQYYSNSILTIQTSNYEGFGMTIIEAMSCGIPTISFHNYGPDEIIINGKNGYLINKYNYNDFCDKIIKILQNEHLWNKMSTESINIAKRYNVVNFVNKIEKILSK